MTRIIRGTIATAILTVALAVPLSAIAADVDGVWKTETDDKGGYLEVSVGPCSSDHTMTCGVISKAFKKEGEDPSYANLGKPIIENMTSDGGSKFSGGTIWDPENGKTYSADMTLKDDELDVEGCISIICQGQTWKRVK